MATMKAFTAIRPNPAYVERVASLPYDVMSVEEARKIVKYNPYSFLQIDLPEVFLAEDQDEEDEIKYDYAKEHLDKLIKDGIIAKDKDESYYIYQLENDTVTQRGIVALASVEEYNKGTIKKHENTRADKAIDRINHVDRCNAHTGPIFLVYKKNINLQGLIRAYISKEEPIYHFTADDQVVHTVWKMDKGTGALVAAEFKKIDSLYIADGHHRAAAAAAVGNQRKTAKSQHFLTVAFDEDELHIMDYNRVVHDLNGLSQEELIESISKDFIIEEVAGLYRPRQENNFGMYVGKKWYSLRAKEHILREGIVESLDVSILQDNLLAPLLAIKEPRTDQRIDFVGGIRGLGHLEELADHYGGVAFSMFPTSIRELMAVADAGELMPPKSTWFEPKPRSGIFINEL